MQPFRPLAIVPHLTPAGDHSTGAIVIVAVRLTRRQTNRQHVAREPNLRLGDDQSHISIVVFADLAEFRMDDDVLDAVTLAVHCGAVVHAHLDGQLERIIVP